MPDTNPYVTAKWVAHMLGPNPSTLDTAATINDHIDSVLTILSDPQALAAAVSSEVLVAALVAQGWTTIPCSDLVGEWIEMHSPWRRFEEVPVESAGGAS